MREERTTEKDRDMLLVHGVSDDGRVAHVVRRRGERLELGQLRPLESGKPLTGEVVSLRRRPELPVLFDVKVEVESPLPKTEASRQGPPRVSTTSFRKGWDLIWGEASSSDADDALPN